MKKFKNILKFNKCNIGIFLSLFILDLGLRLVINNDINYYSITKLSPNLFTASFIFLIIGLLSFMKIKYRKIIYLIINTSMMIITYFEYLILKKENSFISITNVFSFDLGKLLSYTDFKIILVIIISLLISLLTVYFMNKEKDKIKDKFDIFILILIIIILVGGCRGSATMMLGPEIINNKKLEINAKSIYLHDIDNNKKMKVTGLYEYLFLELKDDIINQFKYNEKRIKDYY